MPNLALHGGPAVINKPFTPYNPIGKEELAAASGVIETGILSKYLGCWDPDFYGGPKVQEFELACQKYFNVKHAITVNSWTSGLIAAVGAIGVEPGDEVIVTPWSMCATSTAILHWNAIPVFADIEEETFNLDPEAVEAAISPNTKAIIAADIFGQSCQIDELMDIAKKHQIKVITDTAQSPGTLYKGNKTGTLSDIGGYSLNYHKHIHTGEGGIIVTNDDDYCEKLQLIRNHAEGVVSEKGVTNIANMIGYNFRLGEIESAIGIEQIKKLDRLISERQHYAERLTNGIKYLDGLTTPIIKEGNTHAYYVYPMIIDVERLGVSREKIFQALTAEGIEGLGQGYSNLHLLPMFQNKIAYGVNGFPWSSDICKREISYDKGICPVAERLQDVSFLGLEMCLHNFDDSEIDLIIMAFRKVWAQLDKLTV
jgi:perosamine synthetase